MSIKKAADKAEPQKEGQLKVLWEVIEDGGPCKEGAEMIPISLQQAQADGPQECEVERTREERGIE